MRRACAVVILVITLWAGLRMAQDVVILSHEPERWSEWVGIMK